MVLPLITEFTANITMYVILKSVALTKITATTKNGRKKVEKF